MAGYRQFHTKFWKDEWSIDLDPLERYLFVYLFTNDLSSISGIYRIPLRVIANETGLDIKYVKAALDKFEQQQKILYHDNTLWVVNMQKYHNNASELTQKKVTKDVETIPDNLVKQAYLCFRDTGIFCMDTVSIGYAYQSLKEKAKEKAKAEIKTESEEKAKGDEKPPTPASIHGDYVIRVISQVTGLVSIPDDKEKVLPALEGLYYQHGKDEVALVEYLKPYFQEWISRKSKDGRRYQKTNFAWLYQWAVAGEIPDANSKSKGGVPEATPDRRKSYTEGEYGQFIEH